ncbi:hypothetical protein HNQ81_001698 [Desulfoprunum benzoelyticum]|uniref:Uncharacterized protein n=1 Tax=Desulfoprunum benzoelyticum TaxID=1506996 RepID=A0A840UNY4_9BACT|nr:hypothetical protein [Desulfoprunum benzoelyticum]
MINRAPDETIFSTRPGRSQTNCIPFRGKGRERKPAGTEKPAPIQRSRPQEGLPIIFPRRNQSETPSEFHLQKYPPGVPSTSFILYNRLSPVRLDMILHPFIPPLFHHRIMSWKSQWTGIRSDCRRRMKRSERLERLLENRWRLRHIQPGHRPGRTMSTGGIEGHLFRYQRLTSRQPTPA